jgi:hypothetical protein
MAGWWLAPWLTKRVGQRDMHAVLSEHIGDGAPLARGAACSDRNVLTCPEFHVRSAIVETPLPDRLPHKRHELAPDEFQVDSRLCERLG